MTDRQITLSCIDEVLNSHSHDPFGVLREAGVQAELRERLLEKMQDRVDVTLVPPVDKSLRFTWPEPISTKRVHLEMKVRFPANGPSARRADLVVLHKSKTVELTCEGNGPGDVVAALRPEDVSVAVEVKASPSRTLEQREKYAIDLKRLLMLNENCKIDGFFVLLDKSHSRFGAAKKDLWSSAPVCADDWRAMRDILNEGIQITPHEPDAATAVVMICDLCPNGRIRHTFVWRP